MSARDLAAIEPAVGGAVANDIVCANSFLDNNPCPFNNNKGDTQCVKMLSCRLVLGSFNDRSGFVRQCKQETVSDRKLMEDTKRAAPKNVIDHATIVTWMLTARCTPYVKG